MTIYEAIATSMRIYNEAYKHSLTNESSSALQPTEITLSLRPHQKVAIEAMYTREESLSKGREIDGFKLYSRYSILGDGVGVGKSLMILGHIALLKTRPPLECIPELNLNSTSQMYSLQKVDIAPSMIEAGCLIVVPHTLFRQWQKYIKEQTTLSCTFIQTNKNLDTENLKEKLIASDIVLVSNTLFGNIVSFANESNILWKRVFYDEADTIHIPGTKGRPNTRFTWLISASWANLLFPNAAHYVTHSLLANIMAGDIDPAFRNLLVNHMPNSQHQQYTYFRYYVLSANYFRDFIHTAHPMRGHLVLRCHDDFIKESITLPPITIHTILCKAVLSHILVTGAISSEVRTALHAGDVQTALLILGVKPEEPIGLVEAVTRNRQKELLRLKQTYEFKSSLEYSTQIAKDTALKTLKDRIGSLEEQIKGLTERIENYKEEMCPICFDEAQQPTLTPCCCRVFCGGCILTSLTRQSTCPLCRAEISANSLRQMATTPLIEDKTQPIEELQKKHEQLLRLIKEKPSGRFLVFSRFDNPFLQLQTELETLHISVKQVRGNKDVIASMLRTFQEGKTRVLLLNSMEAGAGLNITAATDVILLHAMTHEEEKQILGRAHRLGRKEPLTVYRLLHTDEIAR